MSWYPILYGVCVCVRVYFVSLLVQCGCPDHVSTISVWLCLSVIMKHLSDFNIKADK